MNHARGVSEALAEFGLEKSAYASAAVGGLLGAGMGYLADPENSWQAAAMGGAAGAAMGHGIGNMTGGNRAHPTSKPAAPPPAAIIAAAPEAPGMASRLRSFLGLRPSGVMDAPGTGISMKAATEFGLSMGPSGPGLSLASGGRERLPGMRRWVPRETVEDVYRQLDMGVDPEDVQPSNSPFTAVANGGAVGGMAGLSLGRSPKAALAGAGIGAAAGLGKHLLGSKNRREDTQEALYGVMTERNEERRGHTLKQQDSARESMPITIATSAGM